MPYGADGLGSILVLRHHDRMRHGVVLGHEWGLVLGGLHILIQPSLEVFVRK